MSDKRYDIKTYRSEDLDRLRLFWAEFEKTETGFCNTSLGNLIDNLGLPYHFPEDNLFIAEKSGIIVGYLDAIPELRIDRVVIDFLMHQESGVKGLFERLVKSGARRAEVLGAKRVHANIPEDRLSAKKTLSKLGFGVVRHFLELRLDLSKANVQGANQVGPTCRPLRRGEEEVLLQIQNRSFADTWGYNPNTLEDIVYRLNLPGASIEDVVVAWEAGKAVGYCWSKYKMGASAGPEGRIHMLGVDPDQRSKRVGEYVLLAGLSNLKKKGVRTVDLTVDEENETALALYRSVGFQVRARSLWFEKELDAPSALR